MSVKKVGKSLEVPFRTVLTDVMSVKKVGKSLEVPFGTVLTGCKLVSQLVGNQPGPASTVEELRTTERDDPGFTPDEGL